jgi:hypothetical protein
MNFTEGERLKAIDFCDDSIIAVGENGVYMIQVVMESGQCAGVPWLAVLNENCDMVSKWNAAAVRGVVYFPKEDDST